MNTTRSLSPVLVWFRRDLRLTDNPALLAAAKSGHPVVPVFVLDDESAGDWAMGAASRWWLHRSLNALGQEIGRPLCLLRGRADELIPKLVKQTAATAVYVNRTVEPWQLDQDARIRTALSDHSIQLISFNGTTLFDPDRVLKSDGTPYRVFTPFYRKGCLAAAEPPRAPLPRPQLTTTGEGRGLALDDLGLLPKISWYQSLEPYWKPGEAGALSRLGEFLETGLPGYKLGRDRPDRRNVSRLSPHLHFGEVSPNQVWHSVLQRQAEPGLVDDADVFMSELGWREFSYYLLRHEPCLPEQNLQKKFDRFPWRSDFESLDRWQKGITGYPIVDAGMRELWQTGYMHNRVRMIVGSFLVKNLLIHWHHGERWFWDTLVDADLANNSASWQWVAGSGADAAPYFRIFNPVTQGRKFDPNGEYVRRFVPELESVSADKIHSPWETPERAFGARDYPEPMVDLKLSRERALAAFKSLS